MIIRELFLKFTIYFFILRYPTATSLQNEYRTRRRSN